MKQIRFTSFGQPSVVAKCVDVADVGEPAAWEVAVHIDAFPINVADLAMLAGRYGTLPKLPNTIGMEAVGSVVQCGTSVTDVAVGDRVVILANNNWSERKNIPAALVHKVPKDADPLQLSMLKVNPASAHLLLTTFETLNPGDWVIQTAPLGSAGQCVIQLAKLLEINTLNVVRTQKAFGEVQRIGGNVALLDGPDLPEQVKSAVGHSHVRLAFDAVGGSGTDRLAQCLVENGSVINYGMLSNEPCQLAPEQTVFRNIDLRGFWLSKVLNRLSHTERTELYDRLSENVATGALEMSIDSCFSMSQIDEALRRAEQNGRKGKVIVTTE